LRSGLYTAAEAEKPGTQNTADSSKTKDKKKETVFFMELDT
jgi:hypothetical protein